MPSRTPSFHRRVATTSSITPGSAASPSTSSCQANSVHSQHHARNHSDNGLPHLTLQRTSSFLTRNTSLRHASTASGTFAPKFIHQEPALDKVDRIEGENDFSGKRYVWIKDDAKAFLQAWVVEELDGGKLLVQCDDGSVWTCPILYVIRASLNTRAIATRDRHRIRRQS